MEQISAIIVDDEALAREGLCLRMQDVDDFEVVATCASGLEALEAIQQHSPDVLFLDIEMPGLTGIQLVEALQQCREYLPKIVFVTGFRDFALDAFDYQAFDYLLKPFSHERLEACLNRIRQACDQQQAWLQHQQLDELLSRKTGKTLDGFMHSLLNTRQTGLDELKSTISMKCGNEWVRVRLGSILWIEAAGDYMCVHTQDGTHIIRKTLKQLENELDGNHFVRVNRSAMVSLEKVVRLSPNSNGEYVAELVSGDKVKVSRKYKFRLDEISASHSRQGHATN